MKKYTIFSSVLAISLSLVWALAWAKDAAVSNSWDTVSLQLPNDHALGQTLANETVYLGGYSGLTFSHQKKNKLYFWAVPDRGPNAKPFAFKKDAQKSRPFLLPNYQPRIVQLIYNLDTRSVLFGKIILLKNADGKPLTGLPNMHSSSNDAYKHEPPTDLKGKPLDLDPYGLDIEGISFDQQGNIWLVDEYGPSIAQFNKKGVMLERFVPFETNYTAKKTVQALPAVLKQRKKNRGFEAVTIVGDDLYAVLQSPLPTKKKSSNLVRIIEFDIKQKKTTGQYVYLLENEKNADKIGGLTHMQDKQFLIIERDGKSNADAVKHLYTIDLSSASNLQDKAFQNLDINSTALESMSDQQLKQANIKPVKKELFLDLKSVQRNAVDKYEGIAYVHQHQSVFLINDNDFGMDGSFNAKTGKLKHGTQLYPSYWVHLKMKQP